MSEKDKIITIPIKPHLKKFIIKSYQATEPMKIEEDSLIGKHVMSMLIDKRIRTAINYNDAHSELLQLELPAEMYKRTPSVKKLFHLNLYFEKLFKHSLFIWVHACANCHVNPYNATKAFCEFYNFDEKEYTHDAAQRAWLRHKNSEYEKKKSKRRQKNIKPVS